MYSSPFSKTGIDNTNHNFRLLTFTESFTFTMLSYLKGNELYFLIEGCYYEGKVKVYPNSFMGSPTTYLDYMGYRKSPQLFVWSSWQKIQIWRKTTSSLLPMENNWLIDYADYLFGLYESKRREKI